jgi:hypothetical protein
MSLNWKCLTIWIAVIFSISSVFAQSMSTSDTASQEGFAAGIVQTNPTSDTPSQGSFRIGLNQTNQIAQTPSQGGFEAGIVQTTPTTETPSQGAFAVGVNQTIPAGEPSSKANYTGAAAGNVAISKVLKESSALHVIVANNGTAPANLTNWKLALNNGSSTYLFPNFVLKPMTNVTVHTHMNANTPTDLYGSNFTWNGTRDVELIDNMGKMVSEYSIRT